MQNRSRNTIWIVDDSPVNLKILTRILESLYQIKYATDGQRALSAIRENSLEIAAIILDIHMPDFTGIDFLKICRNDPQLKDIPVLIASAEDQHQIEKQCLELGASDFILSPYDVSVVRYKLQHVIHRRWFRSSENDPLTGVYTKEKFNIEVKQMLLAHFNEQFVMISVDIDNFKTYNHFFGVEEGDRLLQFMGQIISDCIGEEETSRYARYAADCFLICCPYQEKTVETLVHKIVKRLKQFNNRYSIKPTFGVYIIEEPDQSLEDMENKTMMAAGQCKGKYRKYVGYYDKKQGDILVHEQEVMNRMEAAIRGREFIVYYQPKYNLTTGKPYGAEALVRWNFGHEKMIMPEEFIPVFEKNACIGRLDHYMLEQVCAHQRRILDEGIHPMPVSVNVSLVNLYNPRFVDNLAAMLDKYHILPELIDLEFTESAFFDNTEMITAVMKSLHDKGFRIFMDDFGKGSASLIMLKNLPVDLLKIDMHLLPKNPSQDKGGKILTAIIRMAEWLQIPVVMEGAETEEQIIFLRDINCDYVQGYYFSHPLPEEEYDALLRAGCRPAALPRQDISRQMLKELWTSGAMLDSLFEFVNEPLVVFEVFHEEVHTLRVNRAFRTRFADPEEPEAEAGLLDIKHISPEDKKRVLETAHEAAQGKHMAECEISPYSETEPESGRKKNCWLRIRIQFVERNSSKNYFVAMLTEISELKNAMPEKNGSGEEKFREQIAEVALKLANIPAWEYDPKKKTVSRYGELRLLPGFGDVIENVPETIIEYQLIHPDDIAEYRKLYEKLDAGEPYAEGIFRMKKQAMASKYHYMHISYSNLFDENKKPVRAVGILLSMTEHPEHESAGGQPEQKAHLMTPDTYLMGVLNLSSNHIENMQSSVPELEERLKDIRKETVFREISDYFCEDQETKKFIAGLDFEYFLHYYYQHHQEAFEKDFLKTWNETGKRQWLSLEVYFQKKMISGDVLAFCYVRDIDRRIREKKRLENMANRDRMTGLLNHTSVLQKVRHYLEHDGAKGVHAMFMIDLDNFKTINDTHGHLTGDMIIMKIAEKLQMLFRQSDIIGRFGGDEFLTLMKNIDSEAKARNKAAELSAALSMEVQYKGNRIQCACCIGVSVCCDGDKTSMQMIEEADKALYEAKENGRNGYVIRTDAK